MPPDFMERVRDNVEHVDDDVDVDDGDDDALQ